MPSYEGGGYNIGLGYIDPTDVGAKNMSKMKDEFYQANYPGQSSYWMQGAIDKRFKVGDQSLYQQMYGPNTQYAQRFFLNLLRRHINMICGYQRRNRKSTIALPVLDNDDSLADEFCRVIKYCEQRDGFQEYLSESFEGACDTGQTLLWMYPDYSIDPISGDLFTDSVSYNNFLIDQYWRKMDFSDCKGVWRRRWVSAQQAKTLLPGYGKEIDKIRPQGMRDGRFPLQAELQNIAQNNLFSYDEFLYRTTREATMVTDPYTGESVEWVQEEGDEKDLMERTLQMQPWLIVSKRQIPTVNLSIALGNKEVYNGPNQLDLDIYPCAPTVCYYDPDIAAYAWRCMGIIRGGRDPQFLYNMRKIIELQILQSQVNAGWIFPVDAVTDIKAFRQSSGGDGFLIPLKTGHLPNEIQRIEPSALPSSLMELSRSLAEDMTKIIGTNEELLGAATDDKAGILSMLRQGAGLTTLQTIFDKLDYTQRIYGNIRLQAIRKKFSKGKVRNILGHEPDPRFFLSSIQKYNLTVEEGNYSATQRQTELQQLLTFKEMGMNIPEKSIMRKAIISDKKLIMQDMEEQAQAQAQQAQQQAMIEAQEKHAKIQSLLAKSKADIAKEHDLLASVREKEAKIDDLESNAEHKRTEADLNLVKLMIELEDMDAANFKASWDMAQAIKAENNKNMALIG